MKPTVTLHLGDCLEILKGIEPGSVDAVVTDPPYGDNATHANHLSGVLLRNGESARRPLGFAGITASQLVEMARQWCELSRGWVVFTCEWKDAHRLDDAGLLVRLGIWRKPDGAPQFTGDRPGTGWEAVAICHRPGKKTWNGGGRHAFWEVPKHSSGHHPTEKPVRLITRWLEDFTQPGDTILDPFMGSGTTGVACLRTGRNFIGCELDPAYFEIARKRIEAEQDRHPLFEPRVIQPKTPLLDLIAP
jgi:site-specific DNA-methyltransferase (adenine-specific)